MHSSLPVWARKWLISVSALLSVSNASKHCACFCFIQRACGTPAASVCSSQNKAPCSSLPPCSGGSFLQCQAPWAVKGAPQFINNAGTLSWRKLWWDPGPEQGYKPEHSFSEQVWGLASSYTDDDSPYHPEAREFCEVLDLIRGMNYLTWSSQSDTWAGESESSDIPPKVYPPKVHA